MDEQEHHGVFDVHATQRREYWFNGRKVWDVSRAAIERAIHECPDEHLAPFGAYSDLPEAV